MNTFTCCAALAVLAGCATTTTPNYDAVRQARSAMIINPHASAQPDPAAGIGIGGPAAQEAITRYHDSFKTPPPVVNVINIGGAIGAN